MLPRALARPLARWRLKEPRFAYLFEPPPDDDLVSLDCETTGLDVASAEILSIAAIKIRARRILTSQRLSLLIRRSAPTHRATVLVHHLRAVDSAGGIELDEALEQLLAFIGARPLVGYYLSFDLRMLNKFLRPKLGTGLINRAIEVSELYYDAKTHRLPDRHVDLSFASLSRDLDLPELPAHDPFNDALLAAMAYLRLTGGGWRVPDG